MSSVLAARSLTKGLAIAGILCEAERWPFCELIRSSDMMTDPFNVYPMVPIQFAASSRCRGEYRGAREAGLEVVKSVASSDSAIATFGRRELVRACGEQRRGQRRFAEVRGLGYAPGQHRRAKGTRSDQISPYFLKEYCSALGGALREESYKNNTH